LTAAKIERTLEVNRLAAGVDFDNQRLTALMPHNLDTSWAVSVSFFKRFLKAQHLKFAA
jgi:hypothetical protein